MNETVQGSILVCVEDLISVSVHIIETSQDSIFLKSKETLCEGTRIINHHQYSINIQNIT